MERKPLERTRISLSSDSYIIRSHLSPPPEDLEELQRLCPKDPGKVMIYGREIETPRFFQSFGQSYRFSGMSHDALPLPQVVQKYLDIANREFAEGYGKNAEGYGKNAEGYGKNAEGCAKYNMALVNWYTNGNNYIGPHSDDETQLLPESPIFSISLGETRTFRIRIRAKKTRSIVQDIPMGHGDIIVMCGKMQKEFTHEIVKVSGKRGEAMGMRINMTFRMFQ